MPSRNEDRSSRCITDTLMIIRFAHIACFRHREE